MCVHSFVFCHRARQIFVLARCCISTTSPRFFLERSPNAVVDKTLLDRYRCLDIPQNVIQATYLWIDGSGEEIRGKDRVLSKAPKNPEDLPMWSYDGSSTYQAHGDDSDVLLHPKAIYRDPFKAGNNILVMCETYDSNGPTKWNNRHKLKEAFDKTKEFEPWFGIEQEYTLMGVDGRPFGWPPNGFPAPQGPYYCSAGASCAYGRDIAESHILACLYAGIAFFGTNAEVLPSQWEYQVGTVDALKVSDDIWVSRYILKRIAELYGIDVTFDPKPVEGNWNGSGAHTNFSTKIMREKGLEPIKEAIKKLEKRHCEHIAVYDPKGGQDNIRRLHGRLETSDISTFSWGVASRGVSIRIPKPVAMEGKGGYFEDRRPAANCDPYAVCNALLRTCLLDK